MQKRMQRILLSVVLMGFLSFPLIAQDNAKLEVFGGYQFQGIGGNLGWQMGTTFNGWDAAVTYNINEKLGVTGDFGGNYRSGNYAVTPEVAAEPYHTHLYSFAGGPVYSFDAKGKFKPFAHALMGGTHIDTPVIWGGGGIPDTYGTTTAFTMMLGGGLDYKYTKKISFRLPQFDWVYYHDSDLGNLIGAQSARRGSSPNFADNVRVSVGAVFHF